MWYNYYIVNAHPTEQTNARTIIALMGKAGIKMIHINDTILYSSEGVCTVTDILEQDFGGKTAQYYVLKPIYNSSSTIYVPVDNETLTTKMRRILSAAEIHEIIRAIPNEPPLWIEDEAERKEAYRQILQRGDRMELLRMIKALYDHQQLQRAKGKHLHTADEHFFKEAEKILYNEFALVLQIRPDQVVPFILQQVELAKKEKAESIKKIKINFRV